MLKGGRGATFDTRVEAKLEAEPEEMEEEASFWSRWGRTILILLLILLVVILLALAVVWLWRRDDE